MEHLTWHSGREWFLVRSLLLERDAGGLGACTLLGPEGPGVDLSGLASVPLGLLLSAALLWARGVPPVL